MSVIIENTHSNQSTVNKSGTSSVGKFNAERTKSMVINAALGIEAKKRKLLLHKLLTLLSTIKLLLARKVSPAPMDANVAVKLHYAK